MKRNGQHHFVKTAREMTTAELVAYWREQDYDDGSSFSVMAHEMADRLEALPPDEELMASYEYIVSVRRRLMKQGRDFPPETGHLLDTLRAVHRAVEKRIYRRPFV